jgi:putative transposase
MKTELYLEALQMATEQRTNITGLIHHSDRGSQYASDRYREVLNAREIACSMSRGADCWDNLVAESFFGTLKNELIWRRPWITRQATRDAISEYIEIFYNRIRRHSTIGTMRPARFEERALAGDAKAA